jgi:hypothetical protein
MPDNDVTVKPVSTLMYYMISYNNVDESTVQNPESYSIETPDFTLNHPTKTGYTFAGWTGSNGDMPQLDVTITR